MTDKPKTDTDKTDADKTDAEKMDRKLDDALRDSFPSSDPVSFLEPRPGPRERATDKGTTDKGTDDTKKRG